MNNQQQTQTPSLLKHGYQTRKMNFHRKTSAEIVSEAKNMLASGGGGGTRLVSTRRPITPREPRRQLYGKFAPPGRPPSAFSLRYLQFESRALPSLEPLPATPKKLNALNRIKTLNGNALGHKDTTTTQEQQYKFLRSNSIGSLYDNNNDDDADYHSRIQHKLPALLLPPNLSGSLDDLSEEMPPRKEFRIPKDVIAYNPVVVAAAVGTTTTSSVETIKRNSIIQDKGNNSIMLKKRQVRSLDDNENVQQQQPTSESIISQNKKTIKIPIISKQNRLLRNNDLLAQSSTEILLDMLKAHAGIKECSEETILHINGILTELYTRVKGAKGEWRGAVLGALYGLVECVSPKILLSVARVVLVLCVTGSNLTGACKLVFKVARNETNDNLFVDSDVPELLIDGLGRASPLDEPEACIYGYGAVRFLANASISMLKDPNKPQNTTSANKIRQKTISQRLARHGAVQLMVLHLQIINEAGAATKLTGSPLHALFQLSGALRVLAKTSSSNSSTVNNVPPSLFSTTKSNNCPEIHELYEEQDIQLDLACSHLIRSAEICIGETEVQANIIRTLSVLSEHSGCCEALSDSSGRLGVLLGPCGKDFPDKPLGLVVRLGYILGNIMARHDVARSQLFNNDVAMEYLLNTLDYYSNRNFLIPSTATAGDSVIDVLIKVVRVIANMSVNNEVGYGLGTRPKLGSVLLTLLLAVNKFKQTLNSDIEELLLATLGALHNLSFYQDIVTEDNKHHQSSVAARLADFSVALCVTLSSGPITAKAEAARVLGNMTRSPFARKALCSAGGLKIIVKNLELEDLDIVATSCGILVNLLGDWERRAPFRELKGPLILRDVLQRGAMQEDWLLTAIVCQAFWNFLIDSPNIIGALGEDEADYIAGDLAEYLDEEVIFNGSQPNQMWEQFALVASDLLERIQSSVSYSTSPCGSSDEDDEVQAGRIGDMWRGHFKAWLQEDI